MSLYICVCASMHVCMQLQHFVHTVQYVHLHIFTFVCLLISVRVRPGRRMKLEDAQNVVICLKVHCNFGAFRKKIWQRV